jgi:hypothetical protein
MHGHMNVKFRNNTSKWQFKLNSAFKGLSDFFTHSSRFISANKNKARVEKLGSSVDMNKILSAEAVGGMLHAANVI